MKIFIFIVLTNININILNLIIIGLSIILSGNSITLRKTILYTNIYIDI